MGGLFRSGSDRQRCGCSRLDEAAASRDRPAAGAFAQPVPDRHGDRDLERTFPHHIHLALGHGMSGWMRQAGGQVSSRMTLLREYTQAVCSMLDGNVVTTTGRYTSAPERPVDLAPKPTGSRCISGPSDPRPSRSPAILRTASFCPSARPRRRCGKPVIRTFVPPSFPATAVQQMHVYTRSGTKIRLVPTTFTPARADRPADGIAVGKSQRESARRNRRRQRLSADDSGSPAARPLRAGGRLCR